MCHANTQASSIGLHHGMRFLLIPTEKIGRNLPPLVTTRSNHSTFMMTFIATMIYIALQVGCYHHSANAFTVQHTTELKRYKQANNHPIYLLDPKQQLYFSTKDKSDLVTTTSSIGQVDVVIEQKMLFPEAILDDLVIPVEQKEQKSFMSSPETVVQLTAQQAIVTPGATSIEDSFVVDDLQLQQKNELNIWAARGLLLLVAAIWGTNFASVKYLENLCFYPPCHHPPSEAALARFGLAALVSIPLLINQKWDVIRAGLECGLWISLGYFTQALALSTIDSGQCAFICSLTVVFVPVAAAVLYNKPIRPSNFVAATIALAGVGVLEGMLNINDLLGITPAIAATASHAASDIIASTSEHLQTADSGIVATSTGPLISIANTLGINKGDLLALGQPIGFGTAFLRIEQYQEQLKDVPNRILTIAAAQCVAVGIMALFWVLYDFHGTIPNFSYMIEPHRIAAIGWTGIVTTVVAIFIEGIALQKASATDASLAFSTEPIWASLFGFILLHETLGINSYVGGALILTACLVGAVADLRLSQSNEATKNTTPKN